MHILLYLWSDWRKERRRAELKETAEGMLKEARKRQLHRKANVNSEIIKTAFDIGCGVYERELVHDSQKDAEYAFMLGHLMALQNMAKQNQRQNA